MSNIIIPLIRFIISFILLQVLSLFKVTVIFGSQSAFFSGINIAVPMMGFFGGMGFTAQLLLFRSLIKIFLVSETIFTPLVYHIPTFFASTYWIGRFRSIRLLIPAICMILFNMHPVGRAATYYSWYWIIPILAYFFAERSIFMRALGTTFTAHAVGSVIWLYWVPMTPAMFMTLLPIVFVERLIFALGMVMVYYFGNWITDHIKQYFFFMNKQKITA